MTRWNTATSAVSVRVSVMITFDPGGGRAPVEKSRCGDRSMAVEMRSSSSESTRTKIGWM